MEGVDVLGVLRQKYQGEIPSLFHHLETVCSEKEKGSTACLRNEEELKARFPQTYGRPVLHLKKGEAKKAHPLRVGVVFSGGQAPGGHNVIAGLFDALKKLHQKSTLLGFLDGPNGIIQGKYKELDASSIVSFRNQGGFDLIGSGRTKIESEDQLESAFKTLTSLNLDGLVIIGGDDSNTNAAILAEYLLQKGSKTKVIGVPKTIDGDLQNPWVAIPFGFDTACKVYSEMIGNICKDALSAKKYYHFIKLMGRSASHITLECALKTHPNCALIGEEIAFNKTTLKEITRQLADLVCKREREDKNYGVVLIPEGLIEFIPEIRALIEEINAETSFDKQALTESSRECFISLPEEIQKQLLLDRDPHGNVQVSSIETEKLLISCVKKELKERSYKGKFSPVAHFLGYEGRSALPSNFDANYCYVLGMSACILLKEGLTGYMAFVKNLEKPASEWQMGGLPLTMLMCLEKRQGKLKPVIQKALVDLGKAPFLHFKQIRQALALQDDYKFPGPIQFFGPQELTDTTPLSLSL